VDAAALWTAVRDAAGIVPGQTAALVGPNRAARSATAGELAAMAEQLQMAYGDLLKDSPPGPPTSIVTRLRELSRVSASASISAPPSVAATGGTPRTDAAYARSSDPEDGWRMAADLERELAECHVAMSVGLECHAADLDRLEQQLQASRSSTADISLDRALNPHHYPPLPSARASDLKPQGGAAWFDAYDNPPPNDGSWFIGTWITAKGFRAKSRLRYFEHGRCFRQENNCHAVPDFWQPLDSTPSAREEPKAKGLPPYPLELVAGCKWPGCDCPGRWECDADRKRNAADGTAQLNPVGGRDA
jgi:hypothetical protein